MFQVQKRKDTPRERTTHRKLRRSSWDDILKVSTGYSALSIVLRCYVKTSSILATVVSANCGCFSFAYARKSAQERS